jgi:hypothetical protein
MVIVYHWSRNVSFLIQFEFACCAVIEHANRSQRAKGFRFNIYSFWVIIVFVYRSFLRSVGHFCHTTVHVRVKPSWVMTSLIPGTITQGIFPLFPFNVIKVQTFPVISFRSNRNRNRNRTPFLKSHQEKIMWEVRDLLKTFFHADTANSCSVLFISI